MSQRSRANSPSMRNPASKEMIPVFGIGLAKRPGSPSRSEIAQGFGLIPVGSAGETVGVGSEVASEEKIGGNGVEGTVNKDMTNDGMIFEAQTQIVKPLSQMCDPSGVRACAARKGARVSVR